MKRRDLFDCNYDQAMQHVDNEGRLRLPRDNKKTLYLANWVGRQIKRANVPDYQHARVERLRGLLGQGREEKDNSTWEFFFKWMVEYKEEHHTTRIMRKDIEHRKLHDWSARQHKAVQECRLSLKRRQALENLGFDFHPKKKQPSKARFTKKQEAEWSEMCHKLLDYKEQYGHCLVSYNDETNKALARWVSHQRVTYGKGKMDPSREQILNEVGFVWHVHGAVAQQSIVKAK